MLSLLLALPAFASPQEEIRDLELSRGPAEALGAWLGDEDVEVRRRATLALARLRDEGACDRLGVMAADADAGVREAAAFGLGLTKPCAPRAADLLAAEADPEVRARLVAAMGMGKVEDSVPLLVDALSRSPGEAREAAVSLGRLAMAGVAAAKDPSVTDALARQLRRLDPDARRGAAFALARIGAPKLSDETLAELVRRARTDHDPSVRGWLVRALAAVDERASFGGAVLTAAANDVDQGVRIAAARALPKLGSAEDEPAVRSLLAAPELGVRIEAIRGAAGVKGLPLAELLAPALTAEEPAELSAAIAAMAGADPDFSLRPWLGETTPVMVRVAAVGALDDKAQLLRLATRDTETRLRVAAAARVTELEPTTEDALTLLRSTDDKVAAVGASILAEAPAAASLTVLMEAVAGAGDDDLRVEGLKAIAATLPLVKRPPPALAPLVTELSAHPQLPVRIQARAAAAALGLSLPPFRAEVPPLAEDTASIAGARIFTDAGELRVALYPEVAPLTVANFAALAEQGYYDGVPFHRVVSDFVVQAGCPRGDGWGGPGYAIPDELSWLPYDEGALGMALSGPDTGGSQWFITLSPQPHLDQGYTLFGALVEGGSVARAIPQGAKIQRIAIERVKD